MKEKTFDRMLEDPQTAKMLGWPVQKLRQCRSDGKPVPNYVKYSRRCVRTPESEVRKFIAKYLVFSP